MENDEFEHYREPESQAYLDFKSNGMDEQYIKGAAQSIKDGIQVVESASLKKSLYKCKPKAMFCGITKAGIHYKAIWLDGDKGRSVDFLVPLNEIGDGSFEDEMPAQLLIRYIVRP